MAVWYVAYRKGDTIEMQVVPDRTRAVRAALDMLGRAIDVTEVGPMLDHAPKLSGEEIRAIWQKRGSPVPA
jgi:hypothetical protein